MRRAIVNLVLLALVLSAVGLWWTRPQSLSPDALAGLDPDPENGALVFAAMGCASCHMAPDSDDRTLLSGGKAFQTQFGTFYAPNISSDPEHGIGGWSDLELASAVVNGTSPEGGHYYPAFPYASYIRAGLQDVVDLAAYLRSLPPSPADSIAHQIGFPFSIRASLGGWKLLFVRPDWVVDGDLTEAEQRGRYLVEGLGHCGECHTPRNVLGGMRRNAWLAGAPLPSGDGRTPDIRPGSLQWSQGDIVAYLRTGLTPDYDSAGGEMVDVIENTSLLPDSDLEAIAAYLLVIPIE